MRHPTPPVHCAISHRRDYNNPKACLSPPDLPLPSDTTYHIIPSPLDPYSANRADPLGSVSLRRQMLIRTTLRPSRSTPSLCAVSTTAHCAPAPSIGQVAPAHSSLRGGLRAAGEWKELTVAEIKAELKRRGLSVTGRKDEVILRG